MTVSEAMAKRKSIRAFTPQQVDKSIIREILQAAVRTPSWANSQPWDVFVAMGDSLARIKQAFLDNYNNSVKISYEIPRPADWPDSAKERQRHLHPDMVRDCGDAAAQFGELNQRFFDAPAVIFLCLDNIYEHWGLFDLGAFSQSIMLLAEERGLASIPAINTVVYPNVVRNALNIPDNLKIALGIVIGYADLNHKINNFNSSRSPIEQTVRFFD